MLIAQTTITAMTPSTTQLVVDMKGSGLGSVTYLREISVTQVRRQQPTASRWDSPSCHLGRRKPPNFQRQVKFGAKKDPERKPGAFSPDGYSGVRGEPP